MFENIKPIQDQKEIHQVRTFYEKVDNANTEYFNYWKEETFLQWEFWTSFMFTAIPLIIWWKIHKKESRGRLLFAGFFVLILTCWFDFLGTTFGWWYYTGTVIPTLPSYAPWDFAIFPVIVMLIIQFKPHISVWKKGIFFASFATFVGEPLFWWLGLYVLTGWNMLYSFPIYLIIYVLAHKLSELRTFEKI